MDRQIEKMVNLYAIWIYDFDMLLQFVYPNKFEFTRSIFLVMERIGSIELRFYTLYGPSVIEKSHKLVFDFCLNRYIDCHWHDTIQKSG